VRAVKQLERLIVWFLPVQSVSDEARARFFVEGWLVIELFCALCLTVFGAEQLWAMCGVVLVAMAVGAVVLLSFRRSGRLEAATHVSLAVGALCFPASGLTQTPADPTALSVLALVPPIAAFLIGRRAAVLWLSVTLLLTLGFL
jgi:hypothetical protein